MEKASVDPNTIYIDDSGYGERTSVSTLAGGILAFNVEEKMSRALPRLRKRGGFIA
jgi:hypothetical protein